MFTCKVCQKGFKTQSSKDKHEYEQVCLGKKKTYCRVCDWTGTDILAYNEHIISRSHLDKLGRMTIDNIDIVNIIHDSSTLKLNAMKQADPILADCIENEPDNNVKLFFNDGSIAKVTINNTDLHELTLSSTDKLIRDTELANMTGAGLTYKDLVERERGIAKPTPRQDKIMDYLAKFQGIGPMEMAGKFRIILEKIGMDDADFLGTHIRNCSKLTIESRQIYGTYLDEFVRQLTGLVIKGETVYRDMDLFSFVARLTK
jgi:hypothetical protein